MYDRASPQGKLALYLRLLDELDQAQSRTVDVRKVHTASCSLWVLLLV